MALMEWDISRGVEMKRLNVLLCDDDPVFLQTLRSGLQRTFTKLNRNAEIAIYTAAEQIRSTDLEKCDMAFLDVDLDTGEYNGIDLARRLRKINSRALIFFVTNYIDYAPAGYEVQAFRYILKRDLDEVLGRYVMQSLESLSEEQTCLHLHSRDMIVDIPLKQISYLEVMDHNVSIHTEDKDYEFSATLSGLEAKMENHGFLRIHKSYLVNMAHIRKFRSRECMLADGTTLAVSEKNYSQQKQKYLLWKGLK